MRPAKQISVIKALDAVNPSFDVFRYRKLPSPLLSRVVRSCKFFPLDEMHRWSIHLLRSAMRTGRYFTNRPTIPETLSPSTRESNLSGKCAVGIASRVVHRVEWNKLSFYLFLDEKMLIFFTLIKIRLKEKRKKNRIHATISNQGRQGYLNILCLKYNW